MQMIALLLCAADAAIPATSPLISLIPRPEGLTRKVPGFRWLEHAAEGACCDFAGLTPVGAIFFVPGVCSEILMILDDFDHLVDIPRLLQLLGGLGEARDLDDHISQVVAEAPGMH
jgi:hypothetical protein